jgi:uncharacterized protein
VSFWDSSALVPLLFTQTTTPQAEQCLREDRDIVVWALTPVELTSALFRLLREGALDLAAALAAERRADELLSRCAVVRDLDRARVLARRLLRVHPLRAADAMQLAAALVWADGDLSQRGFHTLDRRLALAASAEGFAAHTP